MDWDRGPVGRLSTQKLPRHMTVGLSWIGRHASPGIPSGTRDAPPPGSPWVRSGPIDPAGHPIDGEVATMGAAIFGDVVLQVNPRSQTIVPAVPALHRATAVQEVRRYNEGYPTIVLAPFLRSCMRRRSKNQRSV